MSTQEPSARDEGAPEAGATTPPSGAPANAGPAAPGAWGSPPTGGALGVALREARAERALDLADVAELTHVRSEYLRALEDGRYEDLPEDVYTRNFVRLFAQATGLDVDSTLETYTRERRSAVGMTTLEESLDRDRRGETPPPPRRGAASGLGTLLPTVLLVLVVVLLALWGYNSLFDRPAVRTAAGTTPAARGPDASGAGSAAAGDQAGAAAPAAGSLAAPAATDAAAGAPAAGSLAAPAGTVGSTVEDRTVLVSIATTPPGARVTIDGYALPGVSPIVNAPVTARDGRVVHVTLDGYQDVERTVDLRSDQALTFAMQPVAAPSSGAVAADGAGTAVGSGQIGIEITEASWLEVYQSTARNTGTRLVYTTAEPGAHYVFDLPVFIHVGNAAGVHVILNGQDRGALGSSGAVLSRAYPGP